MLNQTINSVVVDDLIKLALKEDITSEDVTTNAVFPDYTLATVELICKQDGVICGLEVFKRVFELLDYNTDVMFYVLEGSEVHKGAVLAEVTGDIKVLLAGERTALNYVQRMSGIATYTKRMVEKLEGSGIRLLDTRKTTPNMRVFEKYAVKVGGGVNHRYNLSDGVLLKDNHISGAGSIKKAIALAKNYSPFVRKIEVEVENLEMCKEALEGGADIIMLDNMTPENMKKAVKLIGGRALTECSGNITLENIDSILDTGVNFVSCGSLTHSAQILDLSLKNLRTLEGE